MMSELTKEDFVEGTAPRSDQLNADDLLSGPVTVTVVCLRLTGDKKQPWAVELEQYPGKPFKPCLTMRRILRSAFSDDGQAWVGQQLTLYRDPDVPWGGDKVGGIRISAMSKLPDLNPFPVTLSHNKKGKVQLQPIKQQVAAPTEEEAKYVEVVSAELAAVSTLEELAGHGEILKSKTKPIQDALRPVYGKRKKELEAK